jgi:ABC-2 type transport system ATP-binding protein
MNGDPEVSVVRLCGLGKDYPAPWGGDVLRALDQLELRVGRGEVCGLLGPNGSGKSTTLKLILGLQTPTRGTCEVFGEPASRARVRHRIGFLPESPAFYRYLTGAEVVAFFGKLTGLRGAALRKRVEAAVAAVGMTEAANRRVGTYSRGMVQRIGLAQALVHEPELLVLDEPTAGVDPAGAVLIASLIADLKARGTAVVLTSHLLAEVVEVCDRVAILHRGRLVVDGSLPELLTAGGRGVVVRGLDAGGEDELRRWVETRGGATEPAGLASGRLQRLFLEKTAGGGLT